MYAGTDKGYASQTYFGIYPLVITGYVARGILDFAGQAGDAGEAMVQSIGALTAHDSCASKTFHLFLQGCVREFICEQKSYTAEGENNNNDAPGDWTYR
jgi:hypothetical protein